MDDLYTNAWRDSQESSSSEPKLNLNGSASPCVSPKHSLTVHDEEADLAAPSWSTGAGIRWNEPPEVADFSWSQADSDLAWGASTYEGIDIKSPADTTSQPADDDDVETVVQSRPQSPNLRAFEGKETVLHSSSLPAESSSSPVPSPSLSLASSPSSPDVFGTFESAFASSAAASSAGDKSPQLDSDEISADAWGSAWANENHAADESGRVDEWEAAKQQKAKQDLKVPPEVVSSILQQCNGFCAEVWPESGEKPSASDNNSWRNDWRSGMEGVEGLDPFIQAFLPPLTLQPAALFGKTDIAKKMASSVRLTKHLPLTKGSPMSHYLAARGSTAWEVAVKERKDVVEDDVPVGWRILKKELSTSSPVDSSQGKKHTSRLFSFWSRRQSGLSPARLQSITPSIDQVHSESSSPSSDATHVRSPSHDSVRSAGRMSLDKVPSPVSVTEASSPSPLPATAAAVFPPPQMGSYFDAPEPPSEQSQLQPSPLPSSAMSRFFGRFSHRQSAHSSSSLLSPLALSPDDLEFLSDIPSASDDTEDDRILISSLTTPVKQGPLPPVLPPPPSAPPRVQSMHQDTTPIHKPAKGMDVPVNCPPSADAHLNSLDSFFTSLDAGNSKVGSHTSLASRSSTPPLQPMLPARSVTPVFPTMLAPSKRDSRPLSPSTLSSTSAPITEKQAATPFYLPSPPSSRSQTPSMPSSSTTHQPTPLAHPTPLDRSSCVQPGLSQPRLTSPFTQPPMPASKIEPTENSTSSTASTPSQSPTSARPLAELYPMAMHPRTTPQATTVAMAKAPTAFILSPPPSSRSQPPASTVIAPRLPPPPRALSPSKPIIPAHNVLDDDDFSDFHSSPLPAIPPPPQHRQSASVIPPPSSSMVKVPVASSSKQRLPPALSLSSMRSSTPLIDDDDFSDFRSSVPASALPSSLHPASLQSFDSPSSFNTSTSEQAFLTPHKSAGFDLTGGVSPILRSPSPPALPAKSPTPSMTLPLPSGKATGSPMHGRRRSRTEEVQHTLELMERAAAHPGRWPAPASPLPTALLFAIPPATPSAKPLVDLMSDDAEPQLAQPQGVNAIPMSASLSSPALLGPVRPSSGLGAGRPPLAPTPLAQSHSLQDWGAFEAVQRSPWEGSKADLFTTMPSTPAPTTQTAAKTGGLSAQDLSFFEGL